MTRRRDFTQVSDYGTVISVNGREPAAQPILLFKAKEEGRGSLPLFSHMKTRMDFCTLSFISTKTCKL